MKLLSGVFNIFCGFFGREVSATALPIEALKRCETEGFNASSSGQPLTSNPYPKNSQEYKAWNAGFWVW